MLAATGGWTFLGKDGDDHRNNLLHEYGRVNSKDSMQSTHQGQ